MKCKKCGKELRFGTEQIGIDNKNIPIFHRMGYCDNCRTKIDVDATQYKQVNKNNKSKNGFYFLTTIIIIVILANCSCCVSCLNGKIENNNTSEYVEDGSTSEEEQTSDYSNIMVEEKYKQNFIDACIACGIDAEKVNSFSKIDNWENGERYTFYYNDVMHTVYFLDSSEVNSINYGANNDIKLYEYGYEPLNINDFEIDGGTYASLQIAAESVVKTNLNYPNTANFDWFTTGFCTRYYDYYILGCEFSAQNAFGAEERHSFRIDCIINGDKSDFIYYELDGVVMSGEPNVPVIEKIPINTILENEDGTIKIIEGIAGEYGKEDNFDGEMFIRYYIPSGKYTVTCDTRGSTFYIETIELHKEDGYDVATTIQKISFSSIEESYTIEIKDGECVSLTANSIIYLKPITE